MLLFRAIGEAVGAARGAASEHDAIVQCCGGIGMSIIDISLAGEESTAPALSSQQLSRGSKKGQ